MKNKKLRSLFNKRGWSAGLFWSWNIIFLAFMMLGFAPLVLPELATAVQSGEIPINFLVYGTILALIPVLTVIVGFWRLRQAPERQFALGYGVEGPLMLVLALRFFLIRQSTPAVTLLLVTTALGVLAYLWYLLDEKIETRGTAVAHLRFIGLTLLLIVGLYASVWILFYAIPLFGKLGDLFREIGRSIQYAITNWDWQSIQWRTVPFFILYFPLFAFTGILFMLMPAAITILYARAWWESVRALLAQNRWPRVAVVGTAVLLILALLLIQTDKQPQREAFALLETPPASIAEAQDLLAQEDTLREGLLNAYLAQHRYVSAQGEMDHIQWLYTDTFNISDEQAQNVQRLYEGVTRPVLYQPVNPPQATGNRWENRVFNTEPNEAAKLYEQFFDEPIIEGERETVVRAVRSTWMADQARAGWQAVDDREILLTQQEINVIEHGDWAEVELYEVYQNQTTQRQEVVYYFSLPETAVITGVWLGNSDNRAERFEYRIAPRGAAQQMYQEQVQRRIDPALVEQIGPSQYRLRAFPIEPMRWDWDDTGFSRGTLLDGPPLHLWLTYQVLADGDGWPLPYLAEKRNVFWNDETIRLVNGAAMAGVDEAIWLPTAVPAATPITPSAHRVDFPNGETVLIQPETAVSAPTIPQNLHLAIVLDRSRSMAELAEQTAAALAQLAATGTADLYLTASEYRGEAPSRTPLADFDPAGIVYYGGQNAAELLVQFAELQENESYDAIFVLTDGTGYGLSEGEEEVPVPDAPVWMVHVDGRYPIGYDDPTLQAIQASGGGTVGSVDEALSRLLVENGDVVNGYAFTVLPTEQVDGDFTIHAPSDDFAALAARQFILHQMAQNRASITDLATLDALHALAIEHSIVTPYSSMIVLVTDQQQRRLDQLEEGDDRFEREFEDVGETDQLTVTGVPEPEEWLLIGLAVAMLGWLAYSSRQNSPRKRLA